MKICFAHSRGHVTITDEVTTTDKPILPRFLHLGLFRSLYLALCHFSLLSCLHLWPWQRFALAQVVYPEPHRYNLEPTVVS